MATSKSITRGVDEPGEKKKITLRMGTTIDNPSLQDKLKAQAQRFGNGGPAVSATIQRSTKDVKTGKVTTEPTKPMGMIPITKEEFFNGPGQTKLKKRPSGRAMSETIPKKAAPEAEKPIVVGGAGGAANMTRAYAGMQRKKKDATTIPKQ